MMVEFTEITTGCKVAFRPEIIDAVVEIDLPAGNVSRIYVNCRWVDLHESYAQVMAALRSAEKQVQVHSAKESA